MRNSGPNYIKQVSKESGLTSAFKKLQDGYNKDINIALYMDLDSLFKRKVFQVISTNDHSNFAVNFYGFRMNLTESQEEKLYKLFIREMDSMFRSEGSGKYSILLFCEPSEGKSPMDRIKTIYKKLPAIYYAKLNSIYVVQPCFMVKSFSFITFSSWSKLFNKYLVFVETIEAVQEISELKIHNILCKCPKEITKDVKLLSCQKKVDLNKAALTATERPKPFDLLKRQLGQYEMDHTRKVPMILSILIETMKQNKQSCQNQGIFRCAGSIEDEEEIMKYTIQVKTFKLLEAENFCKRSIAGVIKKVFTQSKTPLIPYNLYNKILNQKIQETTIVQYWRQILQKLPQLNRDILFYIIEFLREFILTKQDINKMNSHNLSVVFTPCFFRSKESCLSDLINSGKFAALFKNLLEKYEQITREPLRIASEQKCSEDVSPMNKSKLNIFRSGMRREVTDEDE